MNPILYAKNETDFSHMGIGVLSDTISCQVTQDAGCYELEMEYPIGGIHFDSIEHSCWLKVICPPRMEASPQLFYIVHISKPLNKKVTILAHHISYKLNFIPIKPFVENEAYTVSNLFTMLKNKATEDFPFAFETDKGAYPVRMSRPYPVMAMSLLGGQEGSLLDIAGGEFIWDNYKVIFKDEVGEDFGYELRYGVNVTDLKQEENISDTITGVVPYWYNEGYNEEPDTLVMLPETTLYSSNASDYPFKRSVTVDFSSELEATYDNDHNLIPPTVAQLRAATQEYISVAGIGVPKVSIDVSMENLARSAEYEYLKPLQQVKLYDIVTVIFPLLHIQKKAKVIKTVFDVQRQKYISITIGERQASLSDRFVTPEQVSSIVDSSAGSVKSAVTNLENEVQREIANIDQEMIAYDAAIRQKIDDDIRENSEAIMGGKGGYVVFGQDTSTDPPHIDEIYIMNTPSQQTATNVIRLNQNGIGFSNNGINGTYTSAWTIGGSFNTDYISGKTITALTIGTATLNGGDITGIRIHGGYIDGTVVEVGKNMVFNYKNSDNTQRKIYVGSGSVSTHLTANSAITYHGLMFQSDVTGTGSSMGLEHSDGIIFNVRSFVVDAKEFAIGSQHGNYSVGITVGNLAEGSQRLILQNRNWSRPDTDYSRIELLFGEVDIVWGTGTNQRAVFSDNGFRYRGTTYTATTFKDGDGHWHTALCED